MRDRFDTEWRRAGSKKANHGYAVTEEINLAFGYVCKHWWVKEWGFLKQLANRVSITPASYINYNWLKLGRNYMFVVGVTVTNSPGFFLCVQKVYWLNDWSLPWITKQLEYWFLLTGLGESTRMKPKGIRVNDRTLIFLWKVEEREKLGELLLRKRCFQTIICVT